MSLTVKPSSQTEARPLLPVALGTALVLVTYVTPIATIPTTAGALDAGPTARAWMLSSMSVGLAGALLATGVLGDTFGRRRVYAAGLAAMSGGALVCAVAQEPVLFVVGRVIEGAGGAAMLACGLAVLAHTFAPGPPRLKATAVWGASVGLGIAGGAVLSAALDIGSGWRESYLATGVAGVVLLAWTLGRLAESSAEHPRRIDVPGLALLITAMTTMIGALTEARDGVAPLTVVLAAVAVGSLVAFVVVESRVAQPLLEPVLWHNIRFRAATLGSLTLGAGMIGMASFVPTITQVGLGRSLWVATFVVLAWALTSVATALLLGRLQRPITGPRPIALFLVVVAVGQLLGLRLSADSPPAHIALSMFVAGLGTGVLNALLGRESVASLPPDRAAMGSGANNTARYLGAAFGITLFVVVASSTGADVVEGWNNAVLVATGITLLGAGAIALGGVRQTSGA